MSMPLAFRSFCSPGKSLDIGLFTLHEVDAAAGDAPLVFAADLPQFPDFQQDLDELERLHEQWLRLIAEHKIPSKETISAVELNKILEQFRLIRAHHAQMQDAELKLDAQLTPSASFDDLHSSTMDEEKDSPPSPTLPPVARPALLKRVGTAVAEQLPIRSILSCLLLMGIGLVMLAMVADEDILLQPGHWSFKFGPHIRYVRGPPPV